MQQQIKSRQRVTEHGEVFTAEREVKAMCDLVKQETERIDSRFLEPACGTGNFLTEILARKLSVVKSEYGRSPLEYEKYSLLAVSSLYGVDIMADNVETCRERLFKQWDKQYRSVCKKECNDDTRKSVRFILSRNILHQFYRIRSIQVASLRTCEAVHICSGHDLFRVGIRFRQ